MRTSIQLLGGLASVAFASINKDGDSNIKIIWEKALASQRSVTTVWSSDLTQLHSYGCGNSTTLDKVVISVDADDEGYGQVFIGRDSFVTSEDLEVSGGISCTRLYNDDYAVTECLAPASKLGAVLPTLALNSTAECFDGAEADDELAPVPLADANSYKDTDLTLDNEEASLDSRGICGNNVRCWQKNPNSDDECCRSWRLTYRPHRKFRRHVTGRQGTCGGGNCHVRGSPQYTHEAMFIGGGGSKPGLKASSGEWTDGGLRVKRRHVAGPAERVCNAKPRETVCVKNYVRFQEYNIQTAYYSVIWEQHVTSDNGYRLRSPLSADGQSIWYCATGSSCRGNGGIEWQDMGEGFHGAAR